MKKTFLIGFLVLLMFTTCRTNKTTTVLLGKSSKHSGTSSSHLTPVLKTDCSKISVSYNSNIKPILETYCIRCHDEDGAAGYNFNRINDLKRAAQAGELIGTIKWKWGFPKMPKNDDQLDINTINTIECWVNNGMKE